MNLHLLADSDQWIVLPPERRWGRSWSGKTVNNWKVGDYFANKRSGRNEAAKNSQAHWKVECVNCGQPEIVSGESLRKAVTKKCPGCGHCRHYRKGEWNKSVLAAVDERVRALELKVAALSFEVARLRRGTK